MLEMRLFDMQWANHLEALQVQTIHALPCANAAQNCLNEQNTVSKLHLELVQRQQRVQTAALRALPACAA